MWFGRRLVKLLAWGVVLCLAVGACAVWFAYAIATDSDTAKKWIKTEFAKILPDCRIDIDKIDVRPLQGKLTISNLRIQQRVDGEPFTSLQIPRVFIRLDFAQLLDGAGGMEPREVLVIQPTLKLRRGQNGVWNVQELIEAPWPMTVIDNPPPILINNGKVELMIDDEGGPEAKPSAPTATAILRDVSLRVEGAEAGAGRLQFDGSAAGDAFNRLALRGEFDPITGAADVSGGLVDLTLTDILRKRLPVEAAPTFDSIGITGGDLDIDLKSLTHDPDAPEGHRIRYDLDLQLRGGVCSRPDLPFPINDLSAQISLRDGFLTLHRADGYNGSTRVRAEGSMPLGDPETTPLNFQLDVVDLPLDTRLKERTPEEYLELWDVFQPKGRINALVDIVRASEGGELELGAKVVCRDVSGLYRHFPYPLKNLNGHLELRGDELLVDLRGPVGDKPARLWGKVINPGPDAIVDLDLTAESVPIDEAFLNALDDEVRPWVDRFKPKGVVKATAHIYREPLVGPEVDPEGLLLIDATLDLGGRCEITWDELPYTIRNLSGTFELHPDLWIFNNLHGRNGQAVITGSGRVEKLPGPDLPNGDPPLKVDMELTANNLPFNEDLRKALPEAWRKTWEFINPNGSSDIQAKIQTQTSLSEESGEPEELESIWIAISPRPESRIRLVVPKDPDPAGDPGETIEMRMEDALGHFVFDNGLVTMTDVTFNFNNAPVQFAKGWVKVEDSGKFDLAVEDLMIKAIQLDSEFRAIMPPLMAQFAMRLDGRFTARGNLQIGWSGNPEELARVSWDQTRVVFVDNAIKGDVPLEHINGQLYNVRGASDGQSLEVYGIMDIDSVAVLGMQVTQLRGPIEVRNGKARLNSLKGQLLGGELFGDGELTLDDEPRYRALLKLTSAELREYAKNLSGRQSFQGLVNASIEFHGRGSDIRTMQGKGEGHISDGDIGELPGLFRLAKYINAKLTPGDSIRGTGKSAFDSADVEFRILNGKTIFDEIKFTGTAFSLKGNGTRDPLDNIDLRLDVLYGRDRIHVPVVSDLLREAGGQLMAVRVTGTSAHPRFNIEVVPQLPRLGAGRGRE